MPRFARTFLALALVLVAAGCRDTLRSGLSEEQANRIAVALDAAQIAAIKVAGPGTGARRYEVQVAAADMPAALRVLEREQLPKPEQAGFTELYGQSGLVATPDEQRARWAAATAGELSRSLERFAGVIDARVHLAPVEAPAALDAQPRPARASVLLRRTPGSPPIDEGAVRALVAGAVDGLAPEQVAVVQTEVAGRRDPTPGLVQIGPISVARSSAAWLKLVLGIALTLDIVLAAAVIALWRRRPRGEHTGPT